MSVKVRCCSACTSSNDKDGGEKPLALFQQSDISQEDLLVGMEATGHYWLSVYGCLLEQGFEGMVIDPIQSQAFRKMHIQQTKSDRKDSSITTIPGIGDAAIILSEIGDIHRFDAPDELAPFAGLDVQATRSGGSTGTRQKISQWGSP